MSIESCGLEPENGRAVFLVSVGTVAELPPALKLPCPQFVFYWCTTPSTPTSISRLISEQVSPSH